MFLSNPAVPFVHHLDSLTAGTLIQISGRTPLHAKWFAVNLQCGTSVGPRDDIALHISPRFEGALSKVIRNSLHNQQWGFEECFGHFPFRSTGQPFEMLILCEEERFRIAVNGLHYTDFGHRKPLNKVNSLSVDGDVELVCIRLESHVPQSPAPRSPNTVSTLHTESAQGLNSRLDLEAIPMPGNRSPFLSTSKRDLGAAAVGFLSGAVSGYGASKLSYPTVIFVILTAVIDANHILIGPVSRWSQCGRSFGGRLSEKKNEGSENGKIVKSSHNRWSSSSDSSSSSASE